MSITDLEKINIPIDKKAAEQSGIARLCLPLPYPPHEMSVYLILGKEPALIDTGIFSPDSLSALETGLKLHGLLLSDLKHVFLTHTHSDHAGLCKYLSDNYKPFIWAHPEDDSRLNGTHAGLLLEKSASFFRLWGADDAAIQKVDASIRGSAKAYLNQKIDDVEYLADGLTLPIQDHGISIIHTPGHSPGCVCFFDNKNRRLYSGDTLIPSAATRPTLSFNGQNDPYLTGYLDLEQSMRKLSELDGLVVMPGHGDPTDFHQLVKKTAKLFKNKRRILAGKLPERFTSYDLIRVRDRRTKGAYFTLDLFQTRAMLEVFLRENMVKMEIQNNREVFFKLP